MGLTKSVLKRPVTVVMVILCLIVFGLQSVLGAKLELMPTMEMPVLIVYSVYPGASPEDVTDLVTKKEEDAITSLDSVDKVFSPAPWKTYLWSSSSMIMAKTSMKHTMT